MERLHHDREFTVDAVAGSQLSNLIAISDASNDAMHPIVFYAKFNCAPGWHKFFLDLGAAFWDLVSDEDVAEDLQDECYNSIRLLEEMTGQTVAEAFAFVPDGTECASINVVFADDRRLAIQCVHDVDGHHTEAHLIG